MDVGKGRGMKVTKADREFGVIAQEIPSVFKMA